MADDRRPRSVYGHGEEPDPRLSLANERTFLAWVRTSLGLLAGSAATSALDLPLADGLQTAMAVVLAVAALGAAVTAWRSWAGVESAMRDGRPLPANPGRLVVLVAVAVVAVVLAVGALVA